MRENRFPTFIKAFADTSFFTILNALFGIITAIILARQLGPESRGILAIIVASVTILSAFSDLYQGGNEIALGKNNNLIKKLFFISFLGALFFSITFFLLSTNSKISNFLLASDDLSIRILASLFFLQIILYDGLRRLLNAKQDFFFINRVELLSTIIFFITFVSFALNGLISVRNILLIYFLSNSIKILISLYKIIKYIREIDTYKTENSWLSEIFRIGKRNFLWSVPYSLIQRMSIWQIAMLSNNSNVGLFRVGTTLTEMVMMIPRSANIITRGKAVSEKGGWDQALVAAKMIFIFGMICSIIFAATGWFLIPIIFGEQFSDVYKVGIILILSTSFFGNVFVLEAQIVSKKRFPNEVIYANYICLAILAILNFFFIKALGLLGAGYAYLLTTICLYLLYNSIFSKYANIKTYDAICINKEDTKKMISFLKQFS
jgi:O-antigen/teichoic acid export membrane protein